MSRMNTKNIKRILVLVCCVTLVISSVVTSTFCVNAEEAAVTSQTTTQESAETGKKSAPVAPVETAAQKKAREKAEKKAATKKRQDKIVKYAKKQIGKSYKYGAKGPKSFDCIGFVYYVFKNAGVKLKASVTYKKICTMKTSYGKYIVSHSLKKAKAGDIVCYYKGSKVKHACVAIGSGKCVNASTKGVRTMKLTGRSGCSVAIIRLVK